jgi:branched-chain amino acid transport system permease protein
LSGVRDPRAYGIAVLVVTLAVALGVAYLRRSPLGKTCLALRANERGATALGISLVRTKLIGIGLAAFIAGIAGALYGYRTQTLSYGTFAAFQSLLVVAFAYLGGIGSIVGAFVGGASLSGAILAHVLHFQGTAGRVMQVIGGVGVMFTVVVHPDGIALLPRDLAERKRNKRARRLTPLLGVPPSADAPLASASTETLSVSAGAATVRP